MIVPLKDASDALMCAAKHAKLVLTSSFAPAAREDLAAIGRKLPLSTELREWYAMNSPLDISIQWFPEYLRLYNPRNLLEWQVGYRWTAERIGKIDPIWDERWVVIGDYTADPVIAHTDQPGTPISMANHGAGVWKPYRVAPALGNYLMAVSIRIEVCTIKYQGKVRDPDSAMLPEVLDDLKVELAAVLEPEYLQHWLADN